MLIRQYAVASLSQNEQRASQKLDTQSLNKWMREKEE